MFRCLSTCFYFGELPLMPGTFGTLPAVALYLIVVNLNHGPLLLLVMLLALLPGGVALADWAGSLSKNEDPSFFVFDEFLGFLVAVQFVNLGSPYLTASCAFLAFRFFDVVKPPPIRKLEGLRRGWGIVLDDVLAGVYANVVLQALAFFV